jgi:hypothetical protein
MELQSLRVQHLSAATKIPTQLNCECQPFPALGVIRAKRLLQAHLDQQGANLSIFATSVDSLLKE